MSKKKNRQVSEPYESKGGVTSNVFTFICNACKSVFESLSTKYNDHRKSCPNCGSQNVSKK